jgi:two-component system, sporulation sensor kinase E
MNRMKIYITMWMAMIIVLTAIPSTASADGRKDSCHKYTELSGWEYRWSPSHESAAGVPQWGMDQSAGGWRRTDSLINLPDRAGQKTLWLRARMPLEEWQDPSLLLQIFQTFEIYLDGTLIYSFGNVDERKPLSYQGTPPRLIPLPAYSGGKQILIRIRSEGPDIGISNGVRLSTRSYFILSLLKSQVDRIILGFFYILLGCAALYGFIRLRQKPFFSFACFTVFFGFYTICRTTIIYFYLDAPKVWTYLELLALMVGSSAALAMIGHLLGEGWARILRRLWQFHLLYMVIALALMLAGLSDIPDILFLYQLILLVSMAIGISQIAFNAWRGNKEAKIILFGTICFCIAGTMDIVENMMFPKSVMPPLTYIGMVVLLITLVIVLIRRLTDFMARLGSSEKLSIAGRLAAGVAHEIRNPITVISGFLQIMERDEKRQPMIDVMLSEVNRINTIVSDFLFLAKPGIPRLERYSLEETVREVIRLFEQEAASSNIKIELDIQKDIPHAVCDKNQLKQVLINVVKNAIESMLYGGNIKVILKKTYDGRALVRVVDQGTGILTEHLPKLGEPFYTTKENGTGLGLMISQAIMESHSGQLSIYNGSEEGTVVDIILPFR